MKKAKNNSAENCQTQTLPSCGRMRTSVLKRESGQRTKASPVGKKACFPHINLFFALRMLPLLHKLPILKPWNNVIFSSGLPCIKSYWKNASALHDNHVCFKSISDIYILCCRRACRDISISATKTKHFLCWRVLQNFGTIDDYSNTSKAIRVNFFLKE